MAHDDSDSVSMNSQEWAGGARVPNRESPSPEKGASLGHSHSQSHSHSHSHSPGGESPSASSPTPTNANASSAPSSPHALLPLPPLEEEAADTISLIAELNAIAEAAALEHDIDMASAAGAVAGADQMPASALPAAEAMQQSSGGDVSATEAVCGGKQPERPPSSSGVASIASVSLVPGGSAASTPNHLTDLASARSSSVASVHLTTDDEDVLLQQQQLAAAASASAPSQSSGAQDASPSPLCHTTPALVELSSASSAAADGLRSDALSSSAIPVSSSTDAAAMTPAPTSTCSSSSSSKPMPLSLQQSRQRSLQETSTESQGIASPLHSPVGCASSAPSSAPILALVSKQPDILSFSAFAERQRVRHKSQHAHTHTHTYLHTHTYMHTYIHLSHFCISCLCSALTQWCFSFSLICNARTLH